MDSGYVNDDVYNGLYWAYYDIGLKTDAIETAKEGVKKFPDPVLYYNLGIAYYEKDWLSEAKDIVEKGLKKFPEDNDLEELLEIIEDEIDNPDDDKKTDNPSDDADNSTVGNPEKTER
jgi:tetratricopeptide (TPR) repeat protein